MFDIGVRLENVKISRTKTPIPNGYAEESLTSKTKIKERKKRGENVGVGSSNDEKTS